MKSTKAKLSKLYLRLKQKKKMVGSNGTMIAIRLVRSKLRKREDHSNAVHPEATVVQTATSPVSTIVEPSYPGEGCCTQTSVTTTSTDLGNSTAVEQDNVYATVNPADQFVWQFPPPYPPPHTPTQYTLYNDQVSTMYKSYFFTFLFSLPLFCYFSSCGSFFSFLSFLGTCNVERNEDYAFLPSNFAHILCILTLAALTSRASITRFYWFIL